MQFFSDDDESASLIVTDETRLCAKLQWTTNHIVTPDNGPCASHFEHWNVKLVAAHRLGTVYFAVYDEMHGSRRFVVFRGYACGTPLPLPIPIVTSINGCRHILNWRQWRDWKRASRCIEMSLRCPAREIVITGYSIGTAYAVLSAVHHPHVVKRLHLFSPFPFSDARLVDRVTAEYVQLWLHGDPLVHCYSPLFRIGRRHRRRRQSYAHFCSPLKYHSSETIALSLNDDFWHEMATLRQAISHRFDDSPHEQS